MSTGVKQLGVRSALSVGLWFFLSFFFFFSVLERGGSYTAGRTSEMRSSAHSHKGNKERKKKRNASQ